MVILCVGSTDVTIPPVEEKESFYITIYSYIVQNQQLL